MESRLAPERGPVKQAFGDGIGLAAIAVRVIGIAAVLARLGWWILPVAVALMGLYVLLGIGGGRRLYEFERRAASRRRRAQYLSDEVLQARGAASERGLFGYASYLNARWRAVYVGVVRPFVLVNIRNWIRYNVILSDVSRAEDEQAVIRALERGGVPAELWQGEEGVDLMLSREFGTRDLSLGQWQRVAIARGLFREHDVILLDEPTASIDPLASAFKCTRSSR